jgi:glutamate carboxypeptidase
MHDFSQPLDWIKTQFPFLKELVRKWCNINSFTSNLEGLSQLLSILREDFACLKAEEHILALPSHPIYHSNGDIGEQALGDVLILKKRPNAPFKVLLAGHMDTVYPPSSPFQKVHEKDAQTWIGPGVTDMKGGLAIMLAALAALEQSPFAEKIGWEVIINSDEEIGSPGSSFIFEEAALRNHIGLVFEPSFPDGAFVSARKGSTSFSIFVTGKPAHVGRDFSEGRHAIYALADFIQRVEQLNDLAKGRIVNVGLIEGGGPINIVPAHAYCRLNMRSGEAADILEIQEKLDDIAFQCQRREGISFKVVRESQRLPKPFDGKTQKLFSFYKECMHEKGLPFHLRETGGVCDGNILSAAGLPTLDSIGAKGGYIHTPEEYLVLPSLVERAQLTVLLLLKLATGEFTFDQEPPHVSA